MDYLFSAPESSCYLSINITNSPCPLSSVVEVLKVLYFLLHFHEIFAFVISPCEDVSQ
jgi:hypothetical protein